MASIRCVYRSFWVDQGHSDVFLFCEAHPGELFTCGRLPFDLCAQKGHVVFTRDTQSKNAELLFRYNLLVLAVDDKEKYGLSIQMLESVGRMKFVRPLYRAIAKNPSRKQLALDTFAKNRKSYHPICEKMVTRDLGIERKE